MGIYVHGFEKPELSQRLFDHPGCLVRLLAKRAEKKDAGAAPAKTAKPVDDGFDMFG